MTFGPRKRLALLGAVAVLAVSMVAWLLLGDTGLLLIVLLMAVLGSTVTSWVVIRSERRLREAIVAQDRASRSSLAKQLEAHTQRHEAHMARLEACTGQVVARVTTLEELVARIGLLVERPSAQHEAILRALHAGFRRIEIEQQNLSEPDRPGAGE